MNCISFKPFFQAFLFLFVFHPSSFAQTGNQMVLQHLAEENGLSDNHVQCVYKDINNFVWAGTLTGLNKLDGSVITSYKHIADDSNSISNNNILCITGDSKGIIWFGTELGLNSYNPKTKNFKVYHFHKKNSGETQYVSSIAAGKSSEIFIGTPSGLFYFVNNNFTQIILNDGKNDLQKNNRITNIIIDHKGILWIATYNGIWSYNPSGNITTHEINSSNDPVDNELFTSIAEGHDGNMWMGSWENGLKKYDPSTRKLITIAAPAGQKNITSLAETKQPDGHYLMWVNGSLIAFDENLNKYIQFQPPQNLNPSVKITKMYHSPDNWLWMCSNEGLFIYNPLKTLFTHHIFTSPITQQDVSILEWNHSLLVSGYGNNFLKAYNKQLIEIENYCNSPFTDKITCLSIKSSGKETIKAGTNKGIADINLKKHTIRYHNLNFLTKDFPAGNFITNLYKDKDESWWIFPWRKGIWQTDSSYHNFHQLFNNFITESGKPKPLVIGDAVADKNDNVWFADYDEGIIFYNKSLHKFSKPFEKELGERYNTYQIIYLNNYCYTFSGAVFYKWNCDSNVLYSIPLPPQMDKQIVSMAIDSSGYIWLATRQGLVVYNVNTKTFDRFTRADGLEKNDMDGQLVCLSGGTIIFGSPEYLTAFEPSKVMHSIGSVPEIVLTDVITNGKSTSMDPEKTMEFGHSINNFIFKWAVTDYNDPLNNNYYYQLAGIDTTWRYVGNSGEVQFANLSPGEYTLLLKGSNANRVYANKIITLHFEIRPPFWHTWLFFVLCGLVIIAFFYSIYRYRLNQFLKLQSLRNKISLDLHDDIGSTLSSISILSEMALRQNKEDKDIEMLQEIKQNSLSLMERIDDIVWSINPKNDSLENLFIRIKDFASKLFEAKELNYAIEIGEPAKQLHLSMEYRQHIYLIMKEAINNLIKYSNCSTAEIIVNSNHSLLNIIVRDDGTGFNPLLQTQGNGLLNMRKRATDMDAKLDITSPPKHGTTINLLVKIK